ncbi:hypothetical protein MYP_442 [Sporocytophaga myxococcoides]|uniref:Uncharacterized protein n=1 Tax=Sporocytophaga myxococcoides TaxID=153721 RepID=A0A098L8P5_9BACT|nr:hypothetical protein [Sporocytophaga myxococcoides]GAL83216.1 hypothetical protein MYP_442 [Sporocytophaga myxococcoides]
MSKASNSEYSIDGRFWISRFGAEGVSNFKKGKENGSFSKAAASWKWPINKHCT